ncbi:hypothetical protein MA16_Dca002131 [Dendrobium catenatum]|uniref:Uncharacterized protein n=1 Tax=Dendrobium catenatum TaxID=906689 RepID=A0A2I0XEH4_9ASPA|nr:hypothetical protein MA16_Dca002131 [Dendrobium catenatum]
MMLLYHTEVGGREVIFKGFFTLLWELKESHFSIVNYRKRESLGSELRSWWVAQTSSFKGSRGALVIKENSGDVPKKNIHVEGKGKSISKEFKIVTPQLDKGLLALNWTDPSTSSLGMKFFGIFTTKELGDVTSKSRLDIDGGIRQEVFNNSTYGPWFLINSNKNIRTIQRTTNVKPTTLKFVKKQMKPVLEVHDGMLNVRTVNLIGTNELELKNSNAEMDQIEEGEIILEQDHCIEVMQAIGDKELYVQANEDIEKSDGDMGMDFTPVTFFLLVVVNKFDVLDVKDEDKV